MLLFGVLPLLPLFGQNRTLVKINKFESRNVPKRAKRGVKNFCAFGAKFFGDSDQALIRTPRSGAKVVSRLYQWGCRGSKTRGGTLGQGKNGGGGAF